MNKQNIKTVNATFSQSGVDEKTDILTDNTIADKIYKDFVNDFERGGY